MPLRPESGWIKGWWRTIAKRQMQIRATQTGLISKKARGEPRFLVSSWDDNAVKQTCQRAVASCLDQRLVTGHCYGLVQGREGEGNRCADQCTGMGEFYSRAHLRLAVAGCTCTYNPHLHLHLHNLAGWRWLVQRFWAGPLSLPAGTTTWRHLCYIQYVHTTILRLIYATDLHVTSQPHMYLYLYWTSYPDRHLVRPCLARINSDSSSHRNWQREMLTSNHKSHDRLDDVPPPSSSAGTTTTATTATTTTTTMVIRAGLDHSCLPERTVTAFQGSSSPLLHLLLLLLLSSPPASPASRPPGSLAVSRPGVLRVSWHPRQSGGWLLLAT